MASAQIQSADGAVVVEQIELSLVPPIGGTYVDRDGKTWEIVRDAGVTAHKKLGAGIEKPLKIFVAALKTGTKKETRQIFKE